MINGIGDLAQSMQMRQRTSQVTTDITQLSQEVVTGRASNITAHLRGDMGALAGLEYDLSRLESYQFRSNEVAVTADMIQAGLGSISDAIDDTLPAITTAVSFPSDGNLSLAKQASTGALERVFQSLNSRGPAGSLFAGAATDTPALVDFEIFKEALDSMIAAAPSIDALAVDIDAFFGTGGGFEATVYQGTNNDLPPQKISNSTSVDLGLSAQNDEFIGLMKSLSKIYAAGAFTASPMASRSQMIEDGYAGLLGAQGGVTELAASVGIQQQVIEDTQIANEVMSSSLELARNDLIGLDPYETASALEERQTQLETIYAITARLSRLTLMDFLR